MGGRKVFDVRFDRPDGEVKWETIRFKVYQRFETAGAIYSVFLGDQKLGTVSWLGCTWQGWDASSHRDFGLMSPDQWERINATLRRLGKPEMREPQEGFRQPDAMRKVEGFKTRRAAAEYLVQHWGFRGAED